VVAQSLAQQQHPLKPWPLRLWSSGRPHFQSAGVMAGLAGERTDARAQQVLEKRGYARSKAHSRRIKPRDFSHFDLILAMDKSVLSELQRQCPAEHLGKLQLFLDVVPDLAGQDVPDPYYGNLQGFEHVLDLCERGAKALLDTLPRRASDAQA
ncbi:MAG: low molecular weight phosphotyrosine protein phosphatase, partial [Burkholderiaceae bacterium]|nr:low molecular weight phosphotyrosine protein phosphatase [Burkholderiaceae bacterium]